MEIVFNKPFGQTLVKTVTVIREITELDELFSERPIEPFVHRIVGRRFGTGKVMRKVERFGRTAKVFGKLRSIVSLNVFNFSGKEIMEPFQEVGGMARMLASIHPGKRDLGIDINAGEDVSLGAVPIDGEAIKGDKKPGARQFGEFRDAFLRLVPLPAFPEPLYLPRMIVQAVLFNDPLHFP